MKNVVLGAGISSLLWLYYHPEYEAYTDQLGRAITGADPLIWPGDTMYMRKWLHDVGVTFEPVNRPIGYMTDWGVVDGCPTYQSLDKVFLKKMIPWKLVQAAARDGVALEAIVPSRTLSKTSDHLAYLECDVGEAMRRTLEVAQPRIHTGFIVMNIGTENVAGRDDADDDRPLIKYDSLVSTIPAPTFVKLWHGSAWSPRLHYVPVTFVISKAKPSWWDDQFVMIYDARVESPVSRVGRFGDQWRYEVTGLVDEEDINGLKPIDGGVFAHPFGRIIQDLVLEPPAPNIKFLGRFAEWDYKGLIELTLERVHGRR